MFESLCCRADQYSHGLWLRLKLSKQQEHTDRAQLANYCNPLYDRSIPYRPIGTSHSPQDYSGYTRIRGLCPIWVCLPADLPCPLTTKYVWCLLPGSVDGHWRCLLLLYTHSCDAGNAFGRYSTSQSRISEHRDVATTTWLSQWPPQP